MPWSASTTGTVLTGRGPWFLLGIISRQKSKFQAIAENTNEKKELGN